MQTAARAFALTRETCGDYPVAAGREWLCTNGIGGYAAGTVAGASTRCYHGLLVAALAPPLDRRVLFAKLDVRVTCGGQTYDLDATRWHDGTLAPAGHVNIESFRLIGTTPVWEYRFAGVRIERRVWMDRGRNATYVTLTVLAAPEPVTFAADIFAVDRDHHARMRAFAAGDVTTLTADGARIALAGTPWYLRVEGASLEPAGEWYQNMSLAREAERGLDDREDLYRALRLHAADVPSGGSITLLATTEADLRCDAAGSRAALREHEKALLERAAPTLGAATAAGRWWLPHLVLAADAFIVDRATPGEPDGKTVIAGYPWFGDWGRDTMIALRGLTLVTGRPEIARSILRTYARYVDAGMLPNRFVDAGQTPEYNTVDATLWFVIAIDAYIGATGDDDTLRVLMPVLREIVDWHLRGTRYGIAVDPADGLLRSGEAGVQLTWMDAKIGDWVVTPRTGKAVEINALWYNALRIIAALGRRSGAADAARYDALADRAQTAFARFWNADRAYLYDVIDGPNGDDPAIRPNAIFAVALSHRLLEPDRERAVVVRAARDLLTSFGLRSLAADEPGYVATYGGDQRARDAAYHCGTVWLWLAGPFIEAHYRVFADPDAVDALLAPFAGLLRGYAHGTLPEIADAAPPFWPRGCFAQAWSVAEVLRVAASLAGTPEARPQHS